MYQPLADKIRPKTLDDVVGQRHLLGENGLLRRVIESGSIPNLIFYGPSGVGKTTVASIIAQQTDRKLYHLNATTAGIADIKAIIDELDTFLAPNGALVYLDEIQYFNKKQQQSLLEFMENGKITLIASTTENPFFYVFGAVLSRSTVFEFKQITAEDALPAVDRGVDILEERLGGRLVLEEGVREHIASACGGDVRKAVNAVELLYQSAKPRDGGLLLTTEDAQVLAQRSAMRYDREGDQHYDLLSALQKSIRGSDPDAAVYYLAKMLYAGEDIKFIARRIMICAAEDVGNADPMALTVAVSASQAIERIGMPEAQIILSQAAIYVATAPKSNSAVNAIFEAMDNVKKMKTSVPSYLQDAHYGGAANMGRGIGYKYAHDYPNHYVEQQYLPDEIKDERFYHPSDNGHEKDIKEWMNFLKNV